MSKSPWTKEVPKEEGFYWMKYRGKKGMNECPCHVMWFRKLNAVHVRSFLNDIWMAGDNHGGPDLKDGSGKADKSLRFGPAIPPVEGKKKASKVDN